MIRATIFTLTMLSAGMTHAISTDFRTDAAKACARAVQADTGYSQYEVIKLHSHSGTGNFSIWLNAEQAPVGAFCRIRNGKVDQLFRLDNHWTRTGAVRPEALLPVASEIR